MRQQRTPSRRARKKGKSYFGTVHTIRGKSATSQAERRRNNKNLILYPAMQVTLPSIWYGMADGTRYVAKSTRRPQIWARLNAIEKTTFFLKNTITLHSTEAKKHAEKRANSLTAFVMASRSYCKLLISPPYWLDLFWLLQTFTRVAQTQLEEVDFEPRVVLLGDSLCYNYTNRKQKLPSYRVPFLKTHDKREAKNLNLNELVWVVK